MKTKAEFLGRSGGFKLASTVVDTRFIKIRQVKLQEITSEEKIIGGSIWNLAGSGDFGNVDTYSNGVRVVTYKATKEERDSTITFELVCLIGNDMDTKVVEPFTKEDVLIKANSLKFSVRITGWPFKDTKNFLTYGIEVSHQDNTTQSDDITNTNATKPGLNLVQLPTGNIYLPKIAIINGEKKDINIKTTKIANSNVVYFSFPAGKTIVYDPDIILDVPSTEVEGESNTSTETKNMSTETKNVPIGTETQKTTTKTESGLNPGIISLIVILVIVVICCLPIFIFYLYKKYV